jgi:hypothetical protein
MMMIIRWEKKEKWGMGMGFAQFEILPTKQGIIHLHNKNNCMCHSYQPILSLTN